MQKQVKVTFDFLSSADFEYKVTALVTPGRPAPPQNFDRFQEPEEPAEIEIIKVVDEDGVDIPVRRLDESIIDDMKQQAIEEYDNDTCDYPEFV